jgi:hypothetical protein
MGSCREAGRDDHKSVPVHGNTTWLLMMMMMMMMMMMH